jgi:hypothetical protein
MTKSFAPPAPLVVTRASWSRALLTGALLFVVGACNRDRTNTEELGLQTARPPVPVGEGQSANVRAAAAGNVGGASAASPSAAHPSPGGTPFADTPVSPGVTGAAAGGAGRGATTGIR